MPGQVERYLDRETNWTNSFREFSWGLKKRAVNKNLLWFWQIWWFGWFWWIMYTLVLKYFLFSPRGPAMQNHGIVHYLRPTLHALEFSPLRLFYFKKKCSLYRHFIIRYIVELLFDTIFWTNACRGISMHIHG